MFRDTDTAPQVARKRSEGRMKTYPSATDARAWSDETEERRQHIIDLIKQDMAKVCSHSYIYMNSYFCYYLYILGGKLRKIRTYRCYHRHITCKQKCRVGRTAATFGNV